MGTDVCDVDLVVLNLVEVVAYVLVLFLVCSGVLGIIGTVEAGLAESRHLLRGHITRVWLNHKLQR